MIHAGIVIRKLQKLILNAKAAALAAFFLLQRFQIIEKNDFALGLNHYVQSAACLAG